MPIGGSWSAYVAVIDSVASSGSARSSSTALSGCSQGKVPTETCAYRGRCSLCNGRLGQIVANVAANKCKRPRSTAAADVARYYAVSLRCRFVIGMAVYTGREARIQKNAARTPSKISTYDYFLSVQIAVIIFL